MRCAVARRNFVVVLAATGLVALLLPAAAALGSLSHDTSLYEAQDNPYNAASVDDTFAFAVGGASVSGSGAHDVLIGSPSAGIGGGVYIHLETGTVAMVDANTPNFGGGPSLSVDDEFGSAAAGVGDVDGDGIEDLVVGNRNANGDDGSEAMGEAWLLFMRRDGSVKSSVRYPAEGVPTPKVGPFTLRPGDRFGSSVARAPDFDGDGRHEVYIGSPNALLTGVVYVLYLHSDGSVVRAERLSEGNRGVGAIASFAGFGAAVADIGDVDHNGVRDLAVGAPFASSNAGEVFVFLLDRDGKVVNHTELASGSDGFGGSWGISRVSTGPGYLLGSALAAAGDVDGDAVPDLLVGSPGRTSAGGALLCFLAGGSDGGGMAASVQTWSPTSVGPASPPAGAVLGRALWADSATGSPILRRVFLGMPPVLGVTSIDVDGRDCHGTLGGSAAIDGCGRCTGGNTGYAFNANGAGNSCELPPVIASLEDSSSGDGWLDLAGFFTDRNLVIVLSAAAVLLVLTIVLVICCCVWTCRGPESRIRGEETAFFVGGRSRSCCGLRWRGCCGAGERNGSSGRQSGSKKKEKKRKLVLTRTEADRGFPYDDEELDYSAEERAYHGTRREERRRHANRARKGDDGGYISASDEYYADYNAGYYSQGYGYYNCYSSGSRTSGGSRQSRGSYSGSATRR